MSQASPTPTTPTRRLDLRHAIVLGVLVLAIVPGLFALKAYQDAHSRSRLLDEVDKRIEQKQPHLALGYLNRYLELNPNDIDALELKGKILAESVQNEFQAQEAIQLLTRVIGKEPDNPKRQESRRRLIELNLRSPGRARAAEAVARDTIRRGADDAKIHRQLAQALEATATIGDIETLEAAVNEYREAERRDPGDVESAERLARLYQSRLNESSKALTVLDALLATNQEKPENLAKTYMARARFFTAMNDPDRAANELKQAVIIEPAGLEVRLLSAEAATHRGETAEARVHLSAIPPGSRDDLRIKLIEGLIELDEQRPDEAIQSWRLGLLQTGGNNLELTWRLAHVMLEIGRVTEADVLIAQYRRLIGGDEPNPRYRYLAGYSLLKKSRIGEATAELEAIRYKVDKPLEPHLNFLLGQCYESAREETKAIEAYRKSAELSTRWNAPWLAVARLQVAERSDEAYATLEQALAAIPGDAQLLAAQAQVLWQQQARRPPDKRSWAEFERVVERAQRSAPNSLELVLVRADQLMATNHPEDALALLSAASRLNPRSVPLWQALANGLRRLNKLSTALAVLDQATASVGPQAGFIVTRAQILNAQGHAKAAKTALQEGATKVPPTQRLAIWKALGEFALGQSDTTGAVQAYREWSRLQPDNPEPRVTLLDLALATGDDIAIRAEVEGMKEVGGPNSPYWRMARVQELLRDHPNEPPDAPRDTRRLIEAAGLVDEVLAVQPKWPLGYLLQGRILEKKGDLENAMVAYEQALDLKGGQLALNPLLSLLIRTQRDDDLARVRRKVATLPRDLERLATVQALKLGDKERAEMLAAQLVQGDPQGLDVRVWQAQVLNALGKPKEAEASLRNLIAEQTAEAAPWAQLLMLQISQKQTAEAAATMERMKANVKTDRPELLWAQCYRALGDVRKADASYAEALAKWPGDVAVWSAAIAYYEQMGYRAEAEEALRHVRTIDPALGWATRKLAALRATHAGDRAAWDEALALIGPEPRPDDVPEDAMVRAGVYSLGPEPRHRQTALKILEDLSGELPNAAPVHQLIARLLLSAGQVDRARAQAAKAAESESATVESVLLYAGTLLASKEYDKAGQQLDRLAKVDPDSLPVAELRARILAAKGQSAQAAAGLESAFAARINAADGRAVGEKMVHLLLELNQPEAAERIARQVGRLGPKGECLLAEFLATRGRADEAVERLRAADQAGDHLAAGSAALTIAGLAEADPRWRVLADEFLTAARKQSPDSFEVIQRLALLRRLQDRHEEEVTLYETLKTLKPTSYLFLNNMAWALSEDLDRPKDGLVQANEAVARIGSEPHILDTRGVIQTRLGNLDEAIKDLEAAAQGLPSGTVYFHLARAYQRKGRLKAFQDSLDRARKLGLRPEQLQVTERADWKNMVKN